MIKRVLTCIFLSVMCSGYETCQIYMILDQPFIDIWLNIYQMAHLLFNGHDI